LFVGSGADAIVNSLSDAADELRHKTFRDITHRVDLPATLASVGNLLSGAVPEYALEKRDLHKDGREIWSLTTVTLQKGADGKPHRFIGVFEDITPRRSAQNCLA
jgi:PAS domain S-box-containing protein